MGKERKRKRKTRHKKKRRKEKNNLRKTGKRILKEKEKAKINK